MNKEVDENKFIYYTYIQLFNKIIQYQFIYWEKWAEIHLLRYIYMNSNTYGMLDEWRDEGFNPFASTVGWFIACIDKTPGAFDDAQQ